MIPHRTPSILPWLYPSLHWRLPAKKKELYLTFDDGPFPGPTEFVLDTLKRYAIKATFFCVGNNIGKYPEIFQRVAAEGHRIGNHTFNHVSGWSLRTSDYLEEISRCDALLSAAGEQNRLFRPPYGRITFKQIRMLADRPVIMWDVLTSDYNQKLSPERCRRNTLKAIRPGSIIVYHDSLKAERNLTYSLPGVIDECLTRGYTFSPIPL